MLALGFFGLRYQPSLLHSNWLVEKVGTPRTGRDTNISLPCMCCRCCVSFCNLDRANIVDENEVDCPFGWLQVIGGRRAEHKAEIERAIGLGV